MQRITSEIDLILALYPEARANLIRAREESGMHPRVVAEQLNVSYPYYRGIEIGKNMPERELAERIGRLFGKDANALMRGGEESEKGR